jgi:Phage tail tube protein
MVQSVGGVAFLKWNGTQYMLRGDLVVSVDTIKRTGVAGQDSVHGFMEVPTVPYIKGTLTDTGGLSLVDFQTMRDGTVTAELNNGKHYILVEAWTADVRELNTSEGSLAIHFEGRFCEEVLAA